MSPSGRQDVVAFVLASSSPGATEDLARPLAGAPVLVRQLEWIYANGIGRAVINRVARDPLPAALAADVLAGTGVRVTWIPSEEPLREEELVRRVARKHARECVVPHGHLGNVDLGVALDRVDASQRVKVTCGSKMIEVRAAGASASTATSKAASGWLAEIVDEGACHELAESVLAGLVSGVEVRGSPLSPGVFRAHGSFVSPRAIVIAPCYFGPDSFVAAGARVGPGAVLGQGAVVEADAEVVHARIAANAVVGRGIRVERGYAAAGRIELHRGRVVSLGDELLLGRRGANARPGWIAASIAARVAEALVAVGMSELSPLARRVARVARSGGSWLGLRDPRDPDGVVLDLAPVLVPQDAADEERSAARAYYARSKSLRRDLAYVVDLVRRRQVA